jgi:hypothetical protein
MAKVNIARKLNIGEATVYRILAATKKADVWKNVASIRNANSRNAKNIYFEEVKRISHGYMKFRVLFKKSEHEFYNRVDTH